MLKQSGIEVHCGIHEAEARRLNEAFITTRRNIALRHLKIAATLDGKIATRNGESQWITSEESRRIVNRCGTRWTRSLPAAALH
jgi:diaminohydroxyphosphoribosylaminopyrimidine deaminase/5-amino-6-(5-phosphoribosylamino)uracil reductase